MKQALLILEDGSIFEGEAFGKIGTTIGEICFNTGMTGYQEIFSDPSYLGQILVMTNVHIGNYGISDSEYESNDFKIGGLICRNLSKSQSRVSARGLESGLNLVGIGDIDTRTLVSHIRSKGYMNCVISSDGTPIPTLIDLVRKHPKLSGQNLSEFASVKTPTKLGEGFFKVAVIDFGIKSSIIENLTSRGVECTIFPPTVKSEEIQEFDGYFLSNGPGDPSAMPIQIDLVNQLVSSNKPIFGICLGHQLIGLANGISTYKMTVGHRGGNHPIKNLETGLCEVTTQNHGFCLVKSEVEEHQDLEVTHIHLNDGTVAGMKMITKPVMSVQYHPEAGPGPNDSKYLFEKFIELLKNAKK